MSVHNKVQKRIKLTPPPNVKVWISGGVLNDVTDMPPGSTHDLIDYDNEPEHFDKEWKKKERTKEPPKTWVGMNLREGPIDTVTEAEARVKMFQGLNFASRYLEFYGKYYVYID